VENGVAKAVKESAIKNNLECADRLGGNEITKLAKAVRAFWGKLGESFPHGIC
jgi:hypothetical protein